jgi:hypothetical protein
MPTRLLAVLLILGCTPSDRNDNPALSIAFPAPQPWSQIGDPFIRSKPQTLGDVARRDHLVMAADALDADEIARPQIAHSGRVERNHGNTCAGY